MNVQKKKRFPGESEGGVGLESIIFGLKLAPDRKDVLCGIFRIFDFIGHVIWDIFN